MMPGLLTVKVVWNKAVVVHGRLKKWMHSAWAVLMVGLICWSTDGGVQKDGGQIHEHFTIINMLCVRFCQ